MPKINKDSTLNITFVGIGLCLLCSAIISFIAIQLRSVQENNVVLDMQKKIVSSAGLVNTCRFMADYIIENDSPPPFYLLPKYSSADVEDMREAFHGKW